MTSIQPRKVRRTVFIGLGGTGNEVIRLVKQEMVRHDYCDLPLFQYLVLDTVAFYEKPGMDNRKRLQNGKEYLYIGGYDPNEVINNIGNWPVIDRWWGNRYQTNLVTVDEGAGQMRSVGRMGFFYWFNKIEVELQRIVQEVTNISNLEAASLNNFDVTDNDPIVYIIFSLCGGTGSSLFFDVAYVMRDLFVRKGLKPTIVGLTMLPGPYIQSIKSMPQRERIQANTYASLMELERLHSMALGVEQKPDGKNIWSVQYSTNFRVDSPASPFEYIYLIDDTTVKGKNYERSRLYQSLSKGIFWLSAPATATHFWERAKNLDSKTASGGGTPDPAGRRRLSPYSSLGVSTLTFNWSNDRIEDELENLIIDELCSTAPIKPSLPNYLHSENAFLEELSGEQTGINPFPASKQLQPNGTFKDKAAVDEMLERYTVKYQAALGSLARSVFWIRKKDSFKADVVAFVDNFMHDSLCARGPIATTQELEAIRDRLNTLLEGVNELSQKAIQRKAELEEEYDSSIRIVQSTNLLAQIGGNIGVFLKKVYLFEPFRRKSTARDLNIAAQNAARQRYLWYQASFRDQICRDITKTVLEPLIAHVDKQKSAIKDVQVELENWRDRNKAEQSVRGNQQSPLRIDQIHPDLSESEQIAKAIKDKKLKLDYVVLQVLKGAFNEWPKPGGDAMQDLKPAIQSAVIDNIKSIGGEKHLIDRLLEPEFDRQRKTFLEGAECLWNFAKDTDQNILSRLEPIEFLGYGIDSHQNITDDQMKPSLDTLLNYLAERPDTVPTDLSDELVLLKTSHGLLISAIKSISDLQRSYQVMNTVRGAPYLHIDYADQVRAGYGPIVHVAVTHKQIIDTWIEVADSIEVVKENAADAMRQAIREYPDKLGIGRFVKDTELLDVDHENHPFFNLKDVFDRTLRAMNQVPAVSQALMKLADLENVLYAQRWMKIDPPIGSRFDVILHDKVSESPNSHLSPGRIVEVYTYGYIRRESGKLPSKRLAGVIVSV